MLDPAKPRRRSPEALLGVALLLGLAACSGGSSAPAGGGGGGADDTGCVGGALCGSSIDADHDGSISQQEWDGAFSRADLDNDGAVTQGEFEAAGGHWGGGGGGGHR